MLSGLGLAAEVIGKIVWEVGVVALCALVMLVAASFVITAWDRAVSDRRSHAGDNATKSLSGLTLRRSSYPKEGGR